jgi:hypothetical protein
MKSRSVRLGLALALPCVFVTASLAQAQATATAPPPATAEKQADTAALPSAQAVIDKHIEAIGGRKVLQSHSSVAVKGIMEIPAAGIKGPVEMYAARPNKMMMKATLAGVGDINEGFDGTTAWTVSPMTGPMIATGEELEQKAFGANFDRTLGMAHAYESMKTVEKTTFEGRPVYKLALTRKGGAVDTEFYDVETGLKAGSIVDVKSPMGTVTATSTLSDYKKFGDVLQPAVLKQTASGAQIVMTFTEMVYDKVDPAVFELPAAIKALIK